MGKLGEVHSCLNRKVMYYSLCEAKSYRTQRLSFKFGTTPPPAPRRWEKGTERKIRRETDMSFHIQGKRGGWMEF